MGPRPLDVSMMPQSQQHMSHPLAATAILILLSGSNVHDATRATMEDGTFETPLGMRWLGGLT